MAPNVEVHFWDANDINGSTILEITDEDTYFESLKLKLDLFSLGGWELTLNRSWGFQLFGSGAVQPEVFVRFLVHSYSDSTYYYGGVLNKRDLVVVHRNEIGAETLTIGGTGPKQYMDRSALGIQQRSGLGMNLDLENGVWRWNEAATAGRVLETVIVEDGLRPNPSLPDLTDNFNLTDDSDGNPWTNQVTTGPAEYETPIGSSLLDVIWDLEDASEIFTTVHLGSVGSPEYELNAFQAFGDDVSGSSFGAGVGLLREGVNITNDSLTVQGVGFRKATHVIVEGKDGVWVTEVKPSWSPGDYVKWDKISYTRSASEDVLHRAGLRWLQRQDNGDQQITVELLPGDDPDNGYYFPAPNDPLWLGNTISLDTVADGSVHSPLDYNNADQLLTGIELELGEAGDRSTADKSAKSWNIKVLLNGERAGQQSAPSQTSATQPHACNCPGGIHPPPSCILPGDETIIADSRDTDGGPYWGANVTTGTCWGGDPHQSIGGSGGGSTLIPVSPGDELIAHVNYREETGDDSWENNGNYAYVSTLELSGPGQPLLTFGIANNLYHNAGCINTTHTATTTVPTGYDNARIRIRYRLGGTRYQAWLSTAGDPAPDLPFCVDPTLPADSPYTYTTDQVDALISQEIASAKVGTLRRYMINNSGGDLEAGDLVIPDTATLDSVTTSTSNHQAASWVGIVTEGGSDGESVLVVWSGLVAALNTPDTPAAGDYVFTSTVAGEADLSATRSAGAVGQIAEDSGELVVYLWGVPDASSGSSASLPWFNVMDYGATGDGTTNDAADINTAIAALNSAGRGVLYFPAGDYNCGTTALTAVTVPGTIMGDGMAGSDAETEYGSRLKTTSGTIALLTIASHGITVRDLALVNNAASEPTAGGGIVVTVGDLTRIERVSVKGFFICVDFQDGYGWTMDHCYILAPAEYGIKIRHVDLPDGGDWCIDNTWVYAADYNAVAAIRQESAGGGKISNVKINCYLSFAARFTNGVDVNITSTTVDLLMVNNSIENIAGDAIAITQTGAATFGDLIFNGNQISTNWGGTNNAGKAISLIGVAANRLTEIIVSNNLFRTNGTARSAIQLTNIDKVTLVGNQLLGNFSSLYTNTTSTNITEITSGVTAHSGLTGLTTGDDHTQYLLETLIAAKGDLYAGSANDTAGILTVGTDGYVLTADSAESLGVKWAAGGGGGHYEVIVSGTAPPVAVTNVAEDDWVYGWVPD